jgi:hypothetical protein
MTLANRRRARYAAAIPMLIGRLDDENPIEGRRSGGAISARTVSGSY